MHFWGHINISVVSSCKFVSHLYHIRNKEKERQSKEFRPHIPKLVTIITEGNRDRLTEVG